MNLRKITQWLGISLALSVFTLNTTAHFMLWPQETSVWKTDLGALAPTSFFIPYQDRVLHGVDTEDHEKTPVLFVHGSPGTWHGWVQYFKSVSLREKFRLIAIDRPGFGHSDYGYTQPDLAEQAHQVAQVFNRAPTDQKFILVGHSFGGPLIAKIAMLYPERVAGLVIAAGSADPDEEFTRWIQIPANWPVVRSIIPPAAKVTNQEIMALWQDLTLMENDWPDITAPVVIIHGTADSLVPVANGDFMNQKLTNAAWVDYQRLEGANHFIVWEHQEKVEAAIHQIQNRNLKSK